MPDISLSNGKKFMAASGSSILDAATQAQVALPYSCKSGRCSSCKCKVVSGETLALTAELGLTQEEREQGWILSCVRSAQTDLVLEVDDLGSVELPPTKTSPCRISHIERLAPDVVRVILRLPPAAMFTFLPGQYIDVIGPNGVRRSYSLANAPATDKTLELHIRAVKGGVMSDYWFNQAKENDLLRLNGPLGTFFLRETSGQDLVFLATGTGIAPVKAMLEALAALPQDQQPASVTVLWGGRTPADIYIDLPSLPGHYQFVPVLSRADEDWAGAKGYVHEVLLQRAADLSHTTVYACGSDAMIHSARKVLVAAGLPARQFYADAFVSSGNI
ncbi:FAD-binding oxidoreductase [Craterilacuibacter sinensis]|uniref:2Fe-2S iron-sulfur cluster binding domain-containing protein n=1 Tax=Craterilacuibacter sinensis TaxID=2686017 RepID=A0A845BU07_9NEIS|nr:FAD-binding oxidoreductase [Craterilacuibacter sinensis]MXR37646.1 2Fe-2S iron-sulfur cluster binding domain-containing protein [Craterilacuibacter sinensis]